MKPQPKILVIVGGTATGKSELAIKLALKLGGEVISADSRQVYKGLDVGTGKISQKDMQGIPHYLIDIVSPKKKFTVVDFKKLADKKIKEIIKKGKLPIICGGTGFYIDAVTKGVVLPEVPPNNKLRKELEGKTTEELVLTLQKFDTTRAQNIDTKNRVRLIRAIEIAKALGKVPAIVEEKPEYKFIKIGLMLPEELFQKKVKTRVRGMFKAGLLKEIETLKKSGVSEKRLEEFGFEYNNPTEESVIKETLRYAKRQMTWFKRDKEIYWLNTSKDVVSKVSERLNL